MEKTKQNKTTFPMILEIPIVEVKLTTEFGEVEVVVYLDRKF